MNTNAANWRTEGMHCPTGTVTKTTKKRAPKFPKTFKKGQVFERLEHPGAFVRVEKMHRTQGTLTLLDRDGYLRLFPQGWMRGTFRAVEHREGRRLFAKVKPNGTPRLTEYSITPARITPEYVAYVKKGVDALDLARGSIASLSEIKRARVPGSHLTGSDKVKVQQSAAPAHVIEEESGIGEGLARRALRGLVKS